MKLTKEQAAEMLNGREYRSEIDGEEADRFRVDGLVAVFGASDDLMEFRGAMDDEVGCYDGGSVGVTADGDVLAEGGHECDCDYCGYDLLRKNGFNIEAVWCDPDIGGSWSYKTEIPHATFDIMEDGELYCRGIVFSMDDLKIGANQ